MDWNFKREESAFSPLPEGRYRIRVKDVEKAVSSNGNDMLVIQFNVSGSMKVLYHYIVFMPDRPEMTNRMLTQFFDSFKDIKMGDFELSHWIGKVGACMIRHEEYNGEKKERISYFIKADKQDELPPWQETNSGSTNSTPSSNTDYDIPF